VYVNYQESHEDLVGFLVESGIMKELYRSSSLLALTGNPIPKTFNDKYDEWMVIGLLFRIVLVK